MITVYVWNFENLRTWGHASMHVGNTYVSWWPRGNGRQPKVPAPVAQRVPLVGNVYSSLPIVGRTFQDDQRDEGADLTPPQPFKRPDAAITINGLDESKIQSWWNALIRDPGARWRTLDQNCSTTVARGLREGGGDALTAWHNWWHTWNFVWTPDDVRRYAEAIVAGLKSRRK